MFKDLKKDELITRLKDVSEHLNLATDSVNESIAYETNQFICSVAAEDVHVYEKLAKFKDDVIPLILEVESLQEIKRTVWNGLDKGAEK